MLHVHGGTIVLEKLRQAGIAGRTLEWCDVLCQGPTPAAVDGAEWLDTRAAFLDGEYGRHNGRGARRRLEEQDAALAAARDEDEIVLWFSADWFCQAILVCLLARLGTSSPAEPRSSHGPRSSSPPVPLSLTGEGARPRVSLVCVGSWPGVDDGRSCTLAHMPAAALHAVLAARVLVDGTIVRDAQRIWDALRAPDPRAVVALVRDQVPTLPFAQEGLRRHLAELPAPRTGLNRTEAAMLEALGEAARKAIDLFPLVANREERRWITDTIFAAALRRLAAPPAPLVQVTPADDLRDALSAERLGAVTVSATPLGRAVLRGEHDWVALAGIDRWVGGVHLTAHAVWRWDDVTGTLTGSR